MASLLLVPGLAGALEVNIYGGLATGFSVRKQAAGDDTTDTSEKAYAGVRFLGPIGLELGYYNLGVYNGATTEVTGASAMMTFNFDIRGMTVFFKGGAMDWAETDLASGAELTGRDLAYGAGINLAVDRHVLFRTELERFDNVGKNTTLNDPGKDMWALTFGVNFQF